MDFFQFLQKSTDDSDITTLNSSEKFVRQQGTLQMANPSVRQGTYNSSNEEFVRQQGTFNDDVVRQQGTIIEKYSLDKQLKRKNFTTNFRHFIV